MNAPVSPDPSELCIDLSTFSPKQMMESIRAQVLALARRKETGHDASSSSDEHWMLPSLKITGCAGQDGIGSGLRNISKLNVAGNLGDFAFTAFEAGDCRIDGRVGSFLGHSIHSGILIVNGHAEHAVGAMGTGGTIAVYGNAGDRIAAFLNGADIVVRGSVGEFAGLGMQQGCLIVGGNTGPNLGHRMRAGTIYVRGEVESHSPDIEEVRTREPDRLKIGLLMLKAGIKATGKEFRVFRPTHG